MLKLVLLAQLAGVALAAVGPTASITVANAVISPDGFERSWVIIVTKSGIVR